MPMKNSWLTFYDYAPYGWAHPFYIALLCEAILVMFALVGWRWASLAAVLVAAALWARGQYTFPPPLTLINGAVMILEMGALIASPGPRRGRSLLNWGHGVVLLLAVAAIKLSSMTFTAFGWQPLARLPQTAWILLLIAGVLVVIAGAAAMRLRLGRHMLWIGAAVLYPYALDLISLVTRMNLLQLDITAWRLAALFIGPVVLTLLAALIAARARLASSRIRITPER
jgi:hypothetical protein